MERARFGWTHAEAAAKIAQKWRLPDEFGRLIAAHAAAGTLRIPRHDDPGALAVAISALLPAGIDESWYERDAFEATYFAAGGRLTPPLVETLDEVDAEFAEFAPILEMAKPPKSLVELFLYDRDSQ